MKFIIVFFILLLFTINLQPSQPSSNSSSSNNKKGKSRTKKVNTSNQPSSSSSTPSSSTSSNQNQQLSSGKRLTKREAKALNNLVQTNPQAINARADKIIKRLQRVIDKTKEDDVQASKMIVETQKLEQDVQKSILRSEKAEKSGETTAESKLHLKNAFNINLRSVEKLKKHWQKMLQFDEHEMNAMKLDIIEFEKVSLSQYPNKQQLLNMAQMCISDLQNDAKLREQLIQKFDRLQVEIKQNVNRINKT